MASTPVFLHRNTVLRDVQVASLRARSAALHVSRQPIGDRANLNWHPATADIHTAHCTAPRKSRPEAYINHHPLPLPPRRGQLEWIAPPKTRPRSLQRLKEEQSNGLRCRRWTQRRLRRAGERRLCWPTGGGQHDRGCWCPPNAKWTFAITCPTPNLVFWFTETAAGGSMGAATTAAASSSSPHAATRSGGAGTATTKPRTQRSRCVLRLQQQLLKIPTFQGKRRER